MAHGLLKGTKSINRVGPFHTTSTFCHTLYKSNYMSYFFYVRGTVYTHWQVSMYVCVRGHVQRNETYSNDQKHYSTVLTRRVGMVR